MTTDKEIVTVREACRRRMPLDGVDAQALEHALTITERERNTARTEGETLRKELSQMRALDKVDCAAMRMTLKGLEGDKDRLERERDNARESLKEVAEDRDTQVKAASGYSTDAVLPSTSG